MFKKYNLKTWESDSEITFCGCDYNRFENDFCQHIKGFENK